MFGKCAVSALLVIICSALGVVSLDDRPALAYRICTFKGMIVGHGWRSMTVRSNGQCAEVNVGWRTKYIPNRRPCLGERVAVDFILEDGYMKATKVVSLTPHPPSVQCYPPAPPSSAVCRTVGGDATEGRDTCVPARPSCSTRPPAWVTDPNWSPGRGAAPRKAAKPSAKKPSKEKKIAKVPEERPEAEPKEAPKETPKETIPKEEARQKSITGEVVSSSPKSLSLRVIEGETAEVVNVKVGLKTKFIPFRRPAVGEKVRIDYRQENGDKFGYTVQVVQ